MTPSTRRRPAGDVSVAGQGDQRPQAAAARLRSGRHGLGEHRPRRRRSTPSGSTGPGTAARRGKACWARRPSPLWTGTRTLMYNLTIRRATAVAWSGPAATRRGSAARHWLYPASATPRATAPRPPRVTPSRSRRRRSSAARIRLHFDARGLAWAGDREQAAPATRSGSTAPGTPARAGRTARRSAARASPGHDRTGRRVRDPGSQRPALRRRGAGVRPRSRARQGKLHGLGAPGHRPAPAGALDALMWSHDPYPAWWPSSWWNSAVAVTAVIGRRRSGHRLAGALAAPSTSTRPRSRPGHAVPTRSRALRQPGDRRRAWWGLAWIAVYDRTHDARYLTEATTIANYVNGFWDTGSCGGGVWWDRERTYKNAVTAGLYLRLTASLHTGSPGHRVGPAGADRG